MSFAPCVGARETVVFIESQLTLSRVSTRKAGIRPRGSGLLSHVAPHHRARAPLAAAGAHRVDPLLVRL